MTDGPDDPSAWPEWDSFVQSHGYLSWLDIGVDYLEDGRAVLVIEQNEDFENPIGTDGPDPVHGGIVATLIDTSSAFALRSTFENPSESHLTTTDLNVSYLRPATGDLRAEAEVLRVGGSTGVTDVTVTGDDGEAAVGRTTYRLFRDGIDSE
ncbi:PaaI family thioesterase [Natrinema thermotolerans]|uniref:PaaI family thioesterase n=1 Tax=Natrinema thermotolerans TaxID=121872 RepID=A0AAF0P8W0_9EURY|nr:PaaI family thioesterase [Natrinema thermotolerans]ELZ12097.1 thioesterase superfamily protein [Natrinema thermotolerans DSM 11552]QCC59660.1 PaaI family thioesterase [Natrinema thermotolerans]WMT06640.1 PaaI family thioesterase [Natrinema thermotolerans]